MNNFFSFSFLFTLCFCCETRSQTNLVYNGDFELYSGCPNTYSDIAQLPNYEIQKCDYWKSPTYSTSDYFNICATAIVNPLNNTSGHQLPKSGNGFLAAIFAGYTGGLGTDGYNGIMWWEYVQGQFIQPLTANHKYNVSFYISLADQSNLFIKEFGTYISSTAISSPNTAALTVSPQVKYINSNYYRDTVNWVQVSGEFVALGGERYITIGNFKDNITTDTLKQYFTSPPPFFSYFYIDNVITYDVTNSDTLAKLNCIETLPTVFTPNADNINDVLEFQLCSKILNFAIYNRWGNLIFESNKTNAFWDGRTTSGEQCIDGNYFYVITTDEKSYKGFVQLIR